MLRKHEGFSVSTHSRPKAAGKKARAQFGKGWFQLTAARRRLGSRQAGVAAGLEVSTHSRPKAAGCSFSAGSCSQSFQLTAARRRLAVRERHQHIGIPFQLTAARRWLEK